MLPTFWRSPISRERLSGLASLDMENKTAYETSCGELIRFFRIKESTPCEVVKRLYRKVLITKD